jgi:hypothetical protein
LIGTILVAVLVVAVGVRATDAVRLRQQEIILAKLSTPEAAAFYQVLRRRAWKVRILRAVALLSLVVILQARNRGAAHRRDSEGQRTATSSSDIGRDGAPPSAPPGPAAAVGAAVGR